nr:AMP-binding protein [Candidatus Aminicenantes bacterium]NIN18911.1 AMP-binding protein [Candidatus Aminicenantes bacterium]NIN42821.1 AMP-binding protein [Candidatus Aminicenantes bacterium]NIN85548.1 AMP-binding protein [Candidatus Aminicenantes bacterium]NIO81812.1 AMP-binding protein [Candidatus Aminicenantes bacterium]
MVEREMVIAVDRLSELIKRECITVFFITTALFNTLVDLQLDCFRDVRSVLFGGERVSVEHVRKALQYLGKGHILHVYGPTETTVYATYYFIDNIDENAVTIPIGKPISDTEIYILAKNLKPVPIGVMGEIYIGGKGLARGYLNRQELTAEKFLFFSYRSYKTYIPEKIYKTGDLARWLPDGTVEFLGRIDLQVKIRGYRIEPGEIENRLLHHPMVKESVVTVRQYENGEKYLCVYVVGASSPKSFQAIDVSSLKEYLSNELPDYMVPDHFVLLEKMPLNPNGKIDMKALPAPKIESGQEYVAPRDDIERRLAKIWLEVLGRDASASIGIDDNFFRLGGHSLNTTILATRIHQAFHVELSLSEVFK